MIAEQSLREVPRENANLVQVFRARVEAMPDAPAARFKQDGAWRDISWKEMGERATRVTNALLAAGVKPGDRICLMGETRFEWVVADLGIQGAGAITVPVYQSNLPDECQYIAANSGAVFVFVDIPAQTAKYARVREQLPGVKHVIQYLGTVTDEPSGWIRPLESFWPEADAFAKSDPSAARAAAASIEASDLSTIIYTSGTTGRPKGVMLSHDAFLFTAESVESLGLIVPGDIELLFLPLAHSFAQVLKGIWLKTGHVMAFAESLEKLIDNMGEVRPTMMTAVPRVFEKAYNKVVSDGSGAPGVSGTLFQLTMAELEKHARARDAGEEYRSLQLSLAKRVVLPRVKERLSERFGGRLRFFISGGAPLSRKIAYFFDLAGIQILEGFGLTETCAATTVNRPHRNKIGTVGAPIPGMEIRIASDGEILIRGRGVMRGYFGNPEATAECLQHDGWFHTGDIGVIDGDGYLRITDRKKDIIVTAGGKNVAPQNLENSLKSNAIISQVVVHGDQRKYLVALVTVAEDRARKIASDKGVSFKDYAELSQHPVIRAEVQSAFDQLNSTLPSYETIKKFTVLRRDLSQETGELTPTLKIKRKVCNELYRSELDAMYGPDVD
jgi:long-chain acyl-CoA synthetase